MKTLTQSISLMLLLTAGAAQAASDSAVITITGRVLANTCTIDGGSATQTITLPNIAGRDISGKGKTGGAKDVVIVLKDCGVAASGVVVSASGSSDEKDTTAFTNAVAPTDGGATGVGVYFFQTDGTTQFLPDGTVTQTSELTPSVDNKFIYKASYVGTSDVVTAGTFSTVVNMTFDYK